VRDRLQDQTNACHPRFPARDAAFVVMFHALCSQPKLTKVLK
jgi:hypothetical protein